VEADATILFETPQGLVVHVIKPHFLLTFLNMAVVVPLYVIRKGRIRGLPPYQAVVLLNLFIIQVFYLSQPGHISMA
jgi:hypothetical protein